MTAALYTGVAYVQVGDLTITPGQVLSGILWNLEPLDGWDEPAQVTDRVDQRNADHGGWTRQGYYEPRTVELKGQLQEISGLAQWGGLAQAWAALKAAVPSFDAVTLTVAAEGAPALQADVIQDGAPILNREGTTWEFSFSLTAPDPRRYDTDETTSSTGLPITTGGLTLPITLPISIGATTTAGLLTLTNEGDVATRPVMTIAGPCPPCTITHSSGRRLSIPDAVDAGRFLTLDTDARTALLDGTASRVVTGTWFELDPGVNFIQFGSATYDAAAELTVSYRNAWR